MFELPREETLRVVTTDNGEASQFWFQDTFQNYVAGVFRKKLLDTGHVDEEIVDSLIKKLLLEEKVQKMTPMLSRLHSAMFVTICAGLVTFTYVFAAKKK